MDWNCGVQPNLKRIQTFQSRILRKITNAPFYFSNHTLHEDLNIPFVHDLTIESYNKFHNRLNPYQNLLVRELTAPNLSHNPPRRLKRQWPETYFNNKNEDTGLNALHLICTYHQNHWLSYLRLITVLINKVVKKKVMTQ
jgi:hypothetical protein